VDILWTNFNAVNNLPMLYICFNDVQYLPEDDQDRSTHVKVMTNCL